jgi:membrane protein
MSPPLCFRPVPRNLPADISVECPSARALQHDGTTSNRATAPLSRGKPMASQWELGGISPVALGSRVWKRIGEDDIAGRSAELAYYFFLALFPLLLVLLAVFGFFAAGGAQLRTTLMMSLARMVPGDASALVSKTVTQVIEARGSGKAILGFLGALWAASAGVSSLMDTLNIAYHVEESRPFWKKRGIAVALTVAVSALMIGAVILLLYGGKLAEVAGGHLHLGAAAVWSWKIAQWPLVLALMFAAFSLVYYFAPNIEEPEWHWISPGAIAGLVLWLLASFGLRVYLHFFNSYNATYGSLGAVVILLLWFYLTGASLLIGGVINAQIAAAETLRTRERERLRDSQEALRRELKPRSAA